MVPLRTLDGGVFGLVVVGLAFLTGLAFFAAILYTERG